MKVAVGCDHAGLSLKNDILPVLEDLGIQWEDFGTTSEDSCDYPDFGIKVSDEVSSGRFERGILVCGDSKSTEMSRLHNDSNILVLPGRVIYMNTAAEMIRVWFTTGFEGGRHKKRLDKISSIEEKLKCR